nr:hypothetical protein [Tanacetum cinerariifolium]
DHLARDDTEVAGIDRNINVRDGGQHAVEQLGSHELGSAFAGAREALGIHHLVAAAQLVVELRNELGRVLQVGVDDDDGLAGGV